MTPYDERDPGAERRWMVTFADLLSLLLTFFLLMFAMSGVKVDAWRSAATALMQRLNPDLEAGPPGPTAERAVDRRWLPRPADLNYLQALLADKLAAEPALAGSSIRRAGDRLVLAVPSAGLFQPSTSRTSAEAGRVVAALAAVLRNVGNAIEIEGHVGAGPVPAGYPSAWELSLARALAFAEALRGAGYPAEIRVLGLADGRYYDVAPDASGSREGRAERVEIVIGDGGLGAGDDEG